jgi:hypothetical protein
MDAGIFRDKEGWASFLEECGSIEDDRGHVCSWIFTALYWNIGITLLSLGFPPRGFSRTQSGYSINFQNTA